MNRGVDKHTQMSTSCSASRQALCAAAYGSMRRLSNCAANDGNSRGFIRRCHSPSPVSAGKPLIPKAALASLFPNASCSDFGMPNRRRISHHPFSDPSAPRVLTASSSNSRFRRNKRSERRPRPSSNAWTYRCRETKPPSSNRRLPFPQLKIAVPSDDHYLIRRNRNR